MRISMEQNVTVQDKFNEFLAEKGASGASPSTIKTYRMHWNAMCHYLEPSGQIENLTKKAVNGIFTGMREDGKKDTTIHSYSITLVAFIRWMYEQHIISFTIKSYKCQEVAKATYTDEELALLLEKPNMRICSFGEYRNWVTVNFLLDTGCRCGTVRNILIEDLDLERGCVYFRHTKNKKAQANPLSGEMVKILREYLRIRKGEPTDYLFCNSEGEQQTESSFRSTMVRYNKSRGVANTNLHSFRHTFARKYLIDLGGDPFRLQRLLGHSTLDMTKHYCNIYDKDLLGMKTPLDTVKKPKKIKIS